jgi:hypothetical protein
MKILLGLLILSFNASASLVQLKFQNGYSIEFDNQVVEIINGPNVPGLDFTQYIYDEATLRVGKGDTILSPILTASESSKPGFIIYIEGNTGADFEAEQNWTDPSDGVSKRFGIASAVDLTNGGDVVGFLQGFLNENTGFFEKAEFSWSLRGSENLELIDSGTTKLVSVNVSAVPVPAAFWMFGTALAALAPRLKRKNA